MVQYIKDIYKNSKVTEYSDEGLLKWAQSIMDLHKEVEKDYSAKYEQYIINTNRHEINDEMPLIKKVKSTVINTVDSIEETDIF